VILIERGVGDKHLDISKDFSEVFVIFVAFTFTLSYIYVGHGI
jgi:hypothetical protein